MKNSVIACILICCMVSIINNNGMVEASLAKLFGKGGVRFKECCKRQGCPWRPLGATKCIFNFVHVCRCRDM